MKRNIQLTPAQQTLVETSLAAVTWVLRESIHPNERIPGLGYDDLYQEGCLYLCRAAQTFEAGRVQFSTYAKKVIRNGLISYCRRQCGRQNHVAQLAVDEDGNLIGRDPFVSEVDGTETPYSEMETQELLRSYAAKYNGVTRLGIEALSLKIKGMSIAEIAELYDVPPSHVGAWISRGKEKLRQDKGFLEDTQ